MSVRFYLHTKTYSDGRRPIYADIRWGKGDASSRVGESRLRTGTGQSCLPDHFTEEGTVSSRAPGYAKTRRELTAFAAKVDKQLELAEATETPLTPDALLAQLKPKRAAKLAEAAAEATPAAPTVRTMATVLTDWQQARRARLGKKSLTNPLGLIQRLDQFRPGDPIRPEEFVADRSGRCRLLDDFCTFLVEEAPMRGGRKGMLNNTVSNYLKALRKLLRYAGQNADWLEDEYLEETEGEPMTYEEVLQLYQHPVFERETTHVTVPRVHVRDAFVFNCLTGPRYQNLAGLKPSDVRLEQIDGHQVPVLQYVQHKRKRNLAPVRVALTPLAYEIWQRYGGKLPVPTNQTMNGVIKQLARAAGIKREITEVRGSGPKRIETVMPFWKAISCHTARHTFITLQYDGGSDIVSIQESVGHSDISMTRKYLKSRPAARHSITLAAFANLDAQRGETGTPPTPEAA